MGKPDLEYTIQRLKAYANAGADCLYAPGIRTPEQISAVVAGVAPKPVNLLMGWPGDFTMQQIAALGVRRVSVGGALARSAWGGFMRSAKLIVDQGKFDGFANAASGKELDAFFTRSLSDQWAPSRGVRRMRRTGGHGRPPRACAKQGLRSAMATSSGFLRYLAPCACVAAGSPAE